MLFLPHILRLVYRRNSRSSIRPLTCSIGTTSSQLCASSEAKSGARYLHCLRPNDLELKPLGWPCYWAWQSYCWDLRPTANLVQRHLSAAIHETCPQVTPLSLEADFKSQPSPWPTAFLLPTCIWSICQRKLWWLWASKHQVHGDARTWWPCSTHVWLYKQYCRWLPQAILHGYLPVYYAPPFVYDGSHTLVVRR